MSKTILKFIELTQTQYDGLTKDPQTIYFCRDTGRIFKGEVDYTGVFSASFDNTTKEFVVTKGGATSRSKIYGIFTSINYENGVLTLHTTGENGDNSNSVNIPVENFLDSVSRKVVSAKDLTDYPDVYEGCIVGDIGILFTMKNGSKMFIPLKDLVDKYVPTQNNGPVTIIIDGYNISAEFSYDTDWFKTTNGKLTISDKFKSDFSNSLEEINRIREEISGASEGSYDIEEGSIVVDSINSVLTSDNEYRFRIDGYVLSIHTFESNDAVKSEQYLTKVNYDKTAGESGTSYVYLSRDEFLYFSNLTPPKNIIKFFALRKTTSN